MPMFGMQSDRQLARDSHADSRVWTGWSLTKELLTRICIRVVWNLYRAGRESASLKHVDSTRTLGQSVEAQSTMLSCTPNLRGGIHTMRHFLGVSTILQTPRLLVVGLCLEHKDV